MGRSVDVGVEQSHLISHLRQRYSQIAGDGGLAHSALAGGDGDDMFPLRLSRFFRRGGELAFKFLVNGHLGVLVHIGFDSRLGGADERLAEGVVLLGEDQRETDGEAADADVVFQHAVGDDVFARSRVTDRSECVYDLLRIHDAS